MKVLLSSALLLVCSNAYAALQCPSTSMVIYSNDWHKYYDQNNKKYVVRDSDLSQKQVCISPRKNPNNPTVKSDDPKVTANVMEFSYPVEFTYLNNRDIFGEQYDIKQSQEDDARGKKTILVTESHKPDFLYIPYFKAAPDFPTEHPTVTLSNSTDTSVYYIRTENTTSDKGKYRQAFRILDSKHTYLKHLEIVSPSISLNLDGSFYTVIKKTGIRCDYYCIQNSGSPFSTVVQSSIHQIYYNKLNDTHATIAINPTAPYYTDNGVDIFHVVEQSSIDFDTSNFLIQTGTAFANSTLVSVKYREHPYLKPAKITVKNSTFNIHKYDNTKSYGFGFHHANYGLADINIDGTNAFTHGTSENTETGYTVSNYKNVPISDIQKNQNLISWKGNGNINFFYNDVDYSPSHYVLQKMRNDSHDRYIRVCVANTCRYSTSHDIYTWQQNTTNLDAQKTYSNGIPDPKDNGIALCQEARGTYHATQNSHIKKVCDNNNLATRIKADNI